MKIVRNLWYTSRVDGGSKRDPACCEAVQNRRYNFLPQWPIDGSVRIIFSIEIYNYLGPSRLFRHRIAEALRDYRNFEAGMALAVAYD